MTNEEAIRRVKKLFNLYVKDEPDSVHYLYAEAVKMSEEALEKQIPKKPIPIDWEQYKDKIINAKYLRGGCWCPNCEHMIKSGQYCVDCGQKLDWSDENDRAD